MLGYLMYRSALVPPRMALFGLIGGPLLILSFVLTLFGAYKNGSTLSGLLSLPEIVWEAFLGIYCAWKGSGERARSPGQKWQWLVKRSPERRSLPELDAT